jgi:zinc transporter ZupT
MEGVMGFLRLIGGTAASLAVMTMAVPAEAQRYRGPRHHHDGGDGVAGFLLGALFVGGIAALSSSEKKKREREAAYQEDYEAPPVEEGEGRAPPPPTGSPVADIPAPGSAEYDGLYDPDAAADRCAVAAEVSAQQFARLSRVTSVSSTVWNGKSWTVKGNVELAESYRDETRRSFAFRCALKAGSEPSVTIPGLAPAV